MDVCHAKCRYYVECALGDLDTAEETGNSLQPWFSLFLPCYSSCFQRLIQEDHLKYRFYRTLRLRIVNLLGLINQPLVVGSTEFVEVRIQNLRGLSNQPLASAFLLRDPRLKHANPV